MSWKIKIVLTLIIVIVIIVGINYFLTSWLTSDITRIEIERVQSPNKLYEYILVEINAGATTAGDYLVYIKRQGEKITKDDREVFGVYDLRGRQIYWKDANTLRLEYESGEIYSFRNHYIINIDGKYHDINIEEICTTKK